MVLPGDRCWIEVPEGVAVPKDLEHPMGDGMPQRVALCRMPQNHVLLHCAYWPETNY